ncbi:MAG TPA: serine hydrolase, partial [Thermoanaerobaculia bacterium]|nr:serine hydrolase [Thermoanaerobaculia bacterium]
RDVVKNRALAYDKAGNRWKLDMHLGNDRGGGGALLTTTGDLLIWNDALSSARLGAKVTSKLQEPATLANGRKLGYARGLFLDSNRGGQVVWHTGSADGYKSLLSRYPEQGLSIAILCNSGDDTDRTAFARRIFDLYVPATVGQKVEGTVPGAHVDLATMDLNSRAGLFFSERTGEPLRLVVDNGKLRVANGPTLLPIAHDRFMRSGAALSFMSQDEFTLQFLSADQFELKSMEGKTTRYRRAQAYAPTAADLQSFAGRYSSDEVGAVFALTAGSDSIVVSFEHAPNRRIELKPADRDAFQRGMMTVRFLRDNDGKVTGFDYSNPVLRNVRFTRLAGQRP